VFIVVWQEEMGFAVIWVLFQRLTAIRGTSDIKDYDNRRFLEYNLLMIVDF
jgi:hypothetical protein